MNSAIILAGLVFTVFLIVSERRFEFEAHLKRRFGVGRDWWVPVSMLVVVLLVTGSSSTVVMKVVSEKIDIIVLIFAFSILSEGLEESGLFTHVAYRVTKHCNSATSVVLCGFVLTSVITFFTSNDIVILLMTPLLIRIGLQMGIQNLRVVLLSQFVAANTLSMGLLIGSPTNIIVAEQLGVGFFEYLVLMAVPAVVAFTSSLLVVFAVIRFANYTSISLFERFEMKEEGVSPLEDNPEPTLTGEMLAWVSIFVFFIGLVAVVTSLEVSLLYSAIPSILVALSYWKLFASHVKSVRSPLASIPYGILFFGLSFFTLAELFSRTGFFAEVLVPFVRVNWGVNVVGSSLASVFGTGVIVNVFNDLPAAAVLAKLLGSVSLAGRQGVLLVQTVLVGLNIGAYLTPIGALAGLVWLNQIRVYKQRHVEDDSVEFPKRTDLVAYGLLHFVVTGFITSLFLVGYSKLIVPLVL